MKPDYLALRATAKGAALDAPPGGDKAEWTHAELAMALAGLPDHIASTFLYPLIGEDYHRPHIYPHLLEGTLKMARREGWPETLQDGRFYWNDLVELALDELKWPNLRKIPLWWVGRVDVPEPVFKKDLEKKLEGIHGLIRAWQSIAYHHGIKMLRDDLQSVED